MIVDDDIYQRAFDSEFFADNADAFFIPKSVARAMCDLHTASNGQSAEEVRLAWLQLYDLLGPIRMGKFIESHCWLDFVPEIDFSNDGESFATLWTDGVRYVRSYVVFTQDVPCDIRFVIE